MRRCVALRARREFIESLADRRFGCQSAQTPVTRRKSKDSGDGELRVRELAPLTVDVALWPNSELPIVLRVSAVVKSRR
jgi:hypothetical protein